MVREMPWKGFFFLAMIVLLVAAAGCSGPATDEGAADTAVADESAGDAADDSSARAQQPMSGAGAGGERPRSSAPRPVAATPPEPVVQQTPEEPPAGGYAESGAVAIPAGMVLVPAGTELQVQLLSSLSTRDTEPGAPFDAKIVKGFFVEGKKVPAGKWTVHGTVLAVTPPQKKKDLPGEMELSFDTVRTPEGDEYPIAGYATEFAGTARSRNVGVVAGAAVVGAILGKKAGGDTKDAIIGAAAGAAAGAGVVRALPGKHLNLEEGTEMTVALVDDAVLPYRER